MLSTEGGSGNGGMRILEVVCEEEQAIKTRLEDQPPKGGDRSSSVIANSFISRNCDRAPRLQAPNTIEFKVEDYLTAKP